MEMSLRRMMGNATHKMIFEALLEADLTSREIRLRTGAGAGECIRTLDFFVDAGIVAFRERKWGITDEAITTLLSVLKMEDPDESVTRQSTA
jgi:hypothetical protein